VERDAFEQLVSEWLDADERAALDARLTKAAARSPELAALWAQYQRLDAILRQPDAMAQVRWDRLRVRIAGATQAAAAGAGDDTLDAALHAEPPELQQVDWQRLQRRIAAAAHGPRRGRRPTTWVWGIGGGAVAAAAALLLMIRAPLPPPAETAPIGEARLTVSAPAAVSVDGPVATAVAIVRVTELRDETVVPSAAVSEPITVFLSIDPPLAASPLSESELLGYY